MAKKKRVYKPRKRGALWFHATKFKGKAFQGTYSRDTKSGERIYVLIHKAKNGSVKEIAFESSKQAKELGWYKA